MESTSGCGSTQRPGPAIPAPGPQARQKPSSRGHGPPHQPKTRSLGAVSLRGSWDPQGGPSPLQPRPQPPRPPSGESARKNWGVWRQGRASTSSFPPSYTVATFRCLTFQLLFPFRESLLPSSQTPRSLRRRTPPPQLSRPKLAIRVRAHGRTRARGRWVPALPPPPAAV